MSRELRFDGRVALVTGAGNGLGRAYALLLASRGARVVVNDLGGSATGSGASASAADAVVEEIKAAGGEAVASYDSVESGERLVQVAMDTWGQLDIVINNAGILRDKTFIKMTEDDWERVYRVHVHGAYKVTAAAWPVMRDQQGYGRIVMTSSAAGIYGNFGQANYSMAKLGLHGFAQTLALEGRKRNVQVNTIAPLAGSRLTETVLPPELIDALRPEYVAPLVAWLCHERCEETGGLFEVGGGFVSKLRWERTEGKTFRLGRAISPEDVESSWKDITDFSKATHPGQIAEAMAPVMANVEAGPSRGGNAFIDVDAALGYAFPPMTSSWDARDLALYGLGVGAASDPLDSKELAYVYELNGAGFRPLPTFGVVPAINCMLQLGAEGHQAPGLSYGIDRILHGEQYTEVLRPLPSQAKVTHKSRIADIFDKGKNALVVTETESFDEAGRLLIRNRITILVRGAGGWGGDRGPVEAVNVAPERTPDKVVEQVIPANQALLYRLSGDWNPLHADPDMARAVGFDRPILHGLCTFGYVGRHAIEAFCGGDPRRFKSINVRFAASVFPGETLVTELWQESPTRIILQARVKERDALVITQAAVELYETIPEAPKKAAAQPAAQAEAAPAASAAPIAADVFQAIGGYVAAHPELIGKIGKSFCFRLKGPDSAWVVNLKDGAGSVSQGEGAGDCTLELSDAHFMAMTRGEANPQQLYFGGDLKISGDVMASQKLGFLSKLDAGAVLAAAKARAGSAAAPAAAAEPAQPGSWEAFIAMGAYVAAHPELIGKIGKIYHFSLKSPDSAWTLNLKDTPGTVVEGAVGSADCTLELAEADFMALVKGEVKPEKLYFGGQLKVSGDVMASQKLTFLSKLDPKEARAAVEAAKKARAAAPKAAAVTATAQEAAAAKAPGRFEALKAKLAARGGSEGGEVIQVQVTAPEGSWVVDLGAGTVEAGVSSSPSAVVTLSDGELDAWAGGASARALYQRGVLRLDGDAGVGRVLEGLWG